MVNVSKTRILLAIIITSHYLGGPTARITMEHTAG